ncbi:alpha/beta fold hydrolase [Piscinibacter sp. XHJ-5]|uniref:alpha/beta hydrolase n=1 Tax=Piscinibacter sp. XHJ-5 TaxID=3037797 RepID=UPI002452B1A2|nr:alpha/beta fold hydrolase [Piscinibacter sp. XHJ-5]
MPNLIRWRWPAVALLAAATFAGCTSLDAQQRKWIFNVRPYASALEDADDRRTVWIRYDSAETGSAVKLHGVWFAHEDAKAPVLLYLHGAGRSIHASTWRIEHMRELGFSVLAIDYRGFGLSGDELPSESIVYEDARAAWQWLAKTHPDSPRYIFGHSLGGAIAVQLASEVPDARGLIVEGTFTSIAEVFQSMKWGWLPVTALITQRFDSASKIERVKAPVLVVHGSRDGLIRPELGRALFERVRSPKKFVLVDGGTHYSTNTLGQPQYREALKELFGL